jgi:carbon storage regulator CsrA
MLALTRRVGEEVVIGDPRKPLGVIRVVEVHGDKVRLSFDFPRDTQINRRELAEQKIRAADGDPTAGPKNPSNHNGTPGNPSSPGTPGPTAAPGSA